MTIPLLPRRAAAWLATAAMVLNAAWPLLANAKPAVPASPSEICSASGLKHASGGAPAAPDKDLHASHCTLCPFGAERGAAISRVWLAPLPSSPAVAPVLARGELPRPQVQHYPAAPPRAPPLPS